MRSSINRLITFQGGFNELIPQLKKGMVVSVKKEALSESLGFEFTGDSPTKGVMVGELWVEVKEVKGEDVKVFLSLKGK